MKLLSSFVYALFLLILMSSCTTDHSLTKPHNDFTNYISADNISLHEVITVNVSTGVYMRMMRGMFPGESRYLGFDEKLPIEAFLDDIIHCCKYDPLYFFEFNNMNESDTMTLSYTPLDFMYHIWGTPTRHYRVVVIFNADINNFEFVEVYHSYANSLNFLHVSESLFSIAEIEANRPFVVSWAGQKHEPVRGVMFTDEDGNARLFSFIENFVGGDVFSWRIVEINKYGELVSTEY